MYANKKLIRGIQQAQFYRFVLALRAEEYKTSGEMEKFIKSGGLR